MLAKFGFWFFHLVLPKVCHAQMGMKVVNLPERRCDSGARIHTFGGFRSSAVVFKGKATKCPKFRSLARYTTLIYIAVTARSKYEILRSSKIAQHLKISHDYIISISTTETVKWLSLKLSQFHTNSMSSQPKLDGNSRSPIQSRTQSPQSLWPAVDRQERLWRIRKKILFFYWPAHYGLHCF